MLKLYHFGPAWGMPDPSPFCLKVIYWLRLAGIPYEPVAGMAGVRSAPKGKLPYIDHDGTIVADSSFIISYLKEQFDDPLGVDVEAREQATAHAVGKMLEENLYFVLLNMRWLDDKNWEQHTFPQFFGKMPAPVRAVIPALLRRSVRKSAHGQGVARHSAEEIDEIGLGDLKSIQDLLEGRAFFHGDKPADIDATVGAFLNSLARPPHASALKDFMLSSATLTGYLDRLEPLIADESKAA